MHFNCDLFKENKNNSFYGQIEIHLLLRCSRFEPQPYIYYVMYLTTELLTETNKNNFKSLRNINQDNFRFKLIDFPNKDVIDIN